MGHDLRYAIDHTCIIVIYMKKWWWLRVFFLFFFLFLNLNLFLFCCLASIVEGKWIFFWKIIQARLDSGDFIFSLSFLWWIDSYHTASVFNSDACIIFLLKNQVIKMSSAYLGFDWGVNIHGKEIHSANSWVPPVYQCFSL